MIGNLFNVVWPWLLIAGVFIFGAKAVRYIARRIFWDR